MKRVVSSSVIILVVFIVVATTLFLYHQFNGKAGGDPLKAIPADAAFYFRFRLDKQERLETMPWWQSMQKNKHVERAHQFMRGLDTVMTTHDHIRTLFSNQPVYIAVSATKADDFDLLFLMGMRPRLSIRDVEEVISMLSGDTVKTRRRSYEGTDIYEYRLPDPADGTFTYALSGDVFIGSFTSFLVEEAIRQQRLKAGPMEEIRELAGMFNDADDRAEDLAVVQFRHLPSMLGVFGKPAKRKGLHRLSTFAERGDLTVHMDADGLLFSGRAVPGDSLQLSYCLGAQVPVRMSLPAVLPLETAMAALYACDVSDWFRYTDRLAGWARADSLAALQDRYGMDLEAKWAGLTADEFGLVITEPAGSNYVNNSFFYIHTADGAAAEEEMHSLCAAIDKVRGTRTMRERYGQYKIGLLRVEGLIPLLFGSRYAVVNKGYYTVIGNALVFANQPSSLRTLIDEIESQHILLNNVSFRKTLLQLEDKCNFLLYAQAQQSRYLLQSFLSPSWNAWWKANKNMFSGWNSVAVQLVGGALMPGLSVEFRQRTGQSGERATLRWSASLDTLAASPPYALTDYSTGTECVLIQDRAHVLYKLNGNGDISWRKQLNGKVISTITAIDLYGNDFTQYLFNTGTDLVLLDEKGRYIHNYPIRLPARATAGLLHVNSGRYQNQIYIPCANGRIYAYEASGKPLPGWNFGQATGPVSQPLDHIQVAGTDYIVGSDDLGDAYILNAAGRQLMVTTGSVFRLNHTRFYPGDGVTSTINTADYTGARLLILPNGETELQPDERTERASAYLQASSPDHDVLHVFLVEGVLKAFDEKMNEVFSSRVAKNDTPESLYIDSTGPGNPVLISHSAETDRAYAFHMSGIPVEGFPVRGGMGSAIADFNHDGRAFFVTVSASGMIYTYSMAP